MLNSSQNSSSTTASASELKKLNTQLKETRTSLEVERANYFSLEQQLNELKKDKDGAAERIKDLMALNEEQQQNIMSMFTKNGQLEEQLKNIEKEKSSVEEELKVMQQKYLDSVAQCDELKKRLLEPSNSEPATREVDSMDVSKLEEEKASLVKELEAIKQEKESIRDKYKTKEKEHRESILALYNKNLFLQQQLDILKGTPTPSESTQNSKTSPSKPRSPDPSMTEQHLLDLMDGEEPEAENEEKEKQESSPPPTNKDYELASAQSFYVPSQKTDE